MRLSPTKPCHESVKTKVPIHPRTGFSEPPDHSGTVTCELTLLNNRVRPRTYNRRMTVQRSITHSVLSSTHRDVQLCVTRLSNAWNVLDNGLFMFCRSQETLISIPTAHSVPWSVDCEPLCAERICHH
eukprot:5651608-Pyramimonas_sp.AAC.1